MQAILFLVFATGVFPLWRAVRATWTTPLAWSVLWAILAWAGWAAVGLAATDDLPAEEWHWLRYLALCLTCCAGVAVLGARRPGADAWNFVVLGLLAVLLLPLVEQLIVGGPSHTWVRLVFLLATLIFLFLNYLPTSFALATFLFALASLRELALASGWDVAVPDAFGEVLNLFALALVPWAAYLCWVNRPRPPSTFDQLWRDFRDRHGFVWAARVRDQFNRAAANAGWPVHLYWQGLRVRRGETPLGQDTADGILETLRAMLKRFSGPER